MSRVIHGQTLKQAMHEADIALLTDIGQFEEYQTSHGYHWRKGLDIDRFFSIAFSIAFARHGMAAIREEVEAAVAVFGDDLGDLAERLVPRRL